MDQDISRVYGNRVRVRVLGLCWQNGQLLMVNHRGLTQGDFWAPPGGGLEFSETVDECLRREFLEETGLQISVGGFLFACEYIERPLHAIELFFQVAIEGGALQKGDDPEKPIIREVRFMTGAEVAAIPRAYLHGIFPLIPSVDALKTLSGFFRI
jgi:8-oxo-dGTP diphosphatase